MSSDVWYGGDQPDPIEPGANPGRLVAVLLDVDGIERQRWLLTADAVGDQAATGAEAALALPGSRMAIFDGDSGDPILVLGTAELNAEGA